MKNSELWSSSVEEITIDGQLVYVASHNLWMVRAGRMYHFELYSHNDAMGWQMHRQGIKTTDENKAIFALKLVKEWEQG